MIGLFIGLETQFFCSMEKFHIIIKAVLRQNYFPKSKANFGQESYNTKFQIPNSIALKDPERNRTKPQFNELSCLNIIGG